MIPEVAEGLVAIAPLLVEALTKGVSKETLIQAIKDVMTELSDAEMKREFSEGG